MWFEPLLRLAPIRRTEPIVGIREPANFNDIPHPKIMIRKTATIILITAIVTTAYLGLDDANAQQLRRFSGNSRPATAFVLNETSNASHDPHMPAQWPHAPSQAAIRMRGFNPIIRSQNTASSSRNPRTAIFQQSSDLPVVSPGTAPARYQTNRTVIQQTTATRTQPNRGRQSVHLMSPTFEDSKPRPTRTVSHNIRQQSQTRRQTAKHAYGLIAPNLEPDQTRSGASNESSKRR